MTVVVSSHKLEVSGLYFGGEIVFIFYAMSFFYELVKVVIILSSSSFFLS